MLRPRPRKKKDAGGHRGRRVRRVGEKLRANAHKQSLTQTAPIEERTPWCSSVKSDTALFFSSKKRIKKHELSSSWLLVFAQVCAQSPAGLQNAWNPSTVGVSESIRKSKEQKARQPSRGARCVKFFPLNKAHRPRPVASAWPPVCASRARAPVSTQLPPRLSPLHGLAGYGKGRSRL